MKAISIFWSRLDTPVKVFAALLILVSILFVSAQPARAALTSTQTQAIINLLVSFGADQATINNVAAALNNTPSYPTYPTYPSSGCPNITRTLFYGMSDVQSYGEVSALQRYLQSTGDYTYPAITGFYGPATVQAVQRWQVRNGVVVSSYSSGYGTFGPMSLQRLRQVCAGGPVTSSGSFSASPTSGAAPLSVTFSNTYSPFTPAFQSYRIRFGDGYEESLASCYAPYDTCLSPGMNSHNYLTPGTYTAQLVYGGSVINSIVIVVSSGTVPQPNTYTFTASPTSGQTPLTVTFSNTYAISPGAIYPAYKVRFGDGTEEALGNCYISYTGQCIISGTNTHTYTTPGTYTVQLVYGNSTVLQTLNVVVSSAPQTPIFTASPTSGQVPLTVNFSSNVGTKIVFGDGSSEQFAYCQALGCPTQGFTISHTYTTAGTYSVLAQNAQGQTLATALITVQAAQQSSTFEATPVSGNSPLTVNFTGSRRTCPGGGVQIAYEETNQVDFGDGQTAQVANCGTFTLTHTYTGGGTFVATFKTAPFGPAPAYWTTLGNKTITVASASGVSFSANPTTGTVPRLVTFTGSRRACPIGGNTVYYDETVRVNFGDGQTQTVANCGTFTLTHTYTASGTYYPRLESTTFGAGSWYQHASVQLSF